MSQPKRDPSRKHSGCHPKGAVVLPCRKDCEKCAKKQAALKEKGRNSVPVAVIFLLLFPLFSVHAQQTVAGKTFAEDPLNHPMTPLLAVMTLVFITMLLIVWVAYYVVRVLNLMTRQLEMQKAVKLGVAYVPSLSWWQRVWDKLNATVPIAQEDDIDLGHNFDGIRELDNHLPPWWKGLFYATIVWSVGYVFVYHIVNSQPLQLEEYQNELAVADQVAAVRKALQPREEIDPDKLVYKADDKGILRGRSVFTGNNCASCHLSDGGGNTIGPNLTDDYWLHGGGIKNIFMTIKNGVVEKGMPAWGKTMSPEDVRSVAFYVMSLQSSHPSKPKAPQGERYLPSPPDTSGVQPLAVKP